MRWLSRHDLHRRDDADGATERDALDACANVALQPGLFDGVCTFCKGSRASRANSSQRTG